MFDNEAKQDNQQLACRQHRSARLRLASIVLVRHGESEGNLAHKAEGISDSPLTTLGRDQAMRVGRQLSDSYSDIVRVCSSPLKRAAETGAIIARSLNVPMEMDEDLREGSLGQWEGMDIDEMEAVYGLSKRICENPYFREHGGESPYQLATRVSRAIERLAARHQDKRVVIVSHGAAIAASLAVLLSTDPISGPQYRLNNATITEVILSPEPRLVTLNGVEV